METNIVKKENTRFGEIKFTWENNFHPDNDEFMIHTCKREVPVVNIICEIGGGIAPISFAVCKLCANDKRTSY